jgi:hypothetical protein
MADRSLPQYDGRPLLAAREMSALAWGTKVTGLNTRGAPMCASGRKQDLALAAASGATRTHAAED